MATGYRILTLNRPDKLNALDAPTHALLRQLLTEAAAAADCRAIILTGSGRGFCTGQDLSKRVFEPGVAPDLGESLERDYNPLIRLIRAIGKPVICAVNGVAAGAGANIALTCDIVIAGRSARFVQSFARLGLVPDSGGSFILPRLVGRARATAALLLGEPVSAEQAADWGMIWECVDDDLLIDRARTLAERLAAQPATGMALTKRLLQQGETATLDEQLDRERDQQRIAGRSPDYAEAVRTFLAARAARRTD
jgi:2-(1,2-epoxy-1,2-dihydrophenyl)acetyl-CoA isomerase